MASSPIDYVALARSATRAVFVSLHDCFFLIGEPELEQSQRGESGDTFESKARTSVAARPECRTLRPGLLQLAVRKAQAAQAGVITVGRTNDNDIVVPDINVSRLHAIFRVHADRVDIADAGSANGTYVNGKWLQPK